MHTHFVTRNISTFLTDAINLCIRIYYAFQISFSHAFFAVTVLLFFISNWNESDMRQRFLCSQ